MIAAVEPVDFVEELRLRRRAREQYIPLAGRDGLHPVILDELDRMDAEGMPAENHPSDDTLLMDEQPVAGASLFGSGIVPLMPDMPGWHGPHEIAGAHANLPVNTDPREVHYT